ncbi:hypothetical protein C922_04084 [Plasmodium inui San Antonio 1]|uniref:Protein kinase domain-containing protein n=1 Tax=Plasmodium inui San Antonio 1 TaxID=1237626 RepID=W7A2L3_9APIC|nr:hypothetical protein C922_04084 [Plasmodium inui San Antonio 1]EUD65578.1 hypothetical protein C922_04084 [Plasmodium inui San Antonio 1]
MFQKDIQESYIKNCFKNIYIVKRHHADGNVEEKKSCVLYKNIDEFVRVLIQIRKYDKEFKKINVGKHGSDVAATLQEYLDFYVGQFGHKFHSFILEYKNSQVKDDVKNHYIIKKLTKSDIEKVANNSYARVMFMYDSVKYLIYYIKKRIAKIREINESFVKLLMSYLRISLNPLDLIAHVYLSGYRGVSSPDQSKKKNLPNGISQIGPTSAWKKMSPIKDHPVVDSPPKDHFFCNELCQFVCAYGEYIIKHTISSSYVELLSRHEIIKSKLSIYESAKRHIRNHIMKKICSHSHFKNCNLSAQFDHDTIFNAHEEALIKFQKIFKRFTQVGSGYKNVSMSHRDFSYIYELVLAVYLVKKCLFHLNENIDTVLQVALYTLYSSAKVTIIYLYFNLPKHMAHYFLNVYLLFFKSKKKNSEDQSQGKKIAHIMNRMRRTYRNVLQYVVKREKGCSEGEECTQEGIPTGETPYEVTPLGGKIKMSERKRYRKILNLLYFQMDSYGKKLANQKSKREVNKFVALHMNGSVIQLKYNYEVLLREKKKCKKKTLPEVSPTKTVKGRQSMIHQNGTVSSPKKRANFVHPDKIEYMKRYAPLYRTKCRSNAKGGKNADRNRSVYIQTNTVNYSMHNRVIYNYRDGDTYARKEKKSENEREVTFYKENRNSEKNIIGKLFHCVLKNLRKGNQFVPSNTREISTVNSFDDYAERNQNERNDYEDSHLSVPSEEISKVDGSISCPVRTILNEHEKGGETPDSCYLSRNGSIQSQGKVECQLLSQRRLDKSKYEIYSVQTVSSKEIQEGGEVTEEVGSEDGDTHPKEVDNTVKRQDDEIAYSYFDPSVGKTNSNVEKSSQERRDKHRKKREANEEVQNGEISPPEKIQNEIEKNAYEKKAGEPPRHGSKTEGHTEEDTSDKESPEKGKQSDDSPGTCSPENITHADLQLKKENKRRTQGKYKMYFSNESATIDVSSDDYNPYRTTKRKGQRRRRKAPARGKRNTSRKTSEKTENKEKSDERTKGKEKERKSRKRKTEQAPKTHTGKTKKRKRSQVTDEEAVKTKKGKSNHLCSYPSVKSDHSKSNEVVEQEEKSCNIETVARKESRERKTKTATEEHAIATNGEHYPGEHKRGCKKESQMSEAKPPTTDDTSIPGSARKLIFNVSLDVSEGGEECTPCKYEFGEKANWGSNGPKGKTPICVDLEGSDNGDIRDDHDNCDVLLLSEHNPLRNKLNESRSVAHVHGKKDKTDEQADKRLDEPLRINTEMPQFDMPFMSTREVYINERVCDIVKDTEERLKLIVIHLFSYYIIGGIFLINPYNSAQKERYRNFTSIEENINDIEYIKIFKYSSHQLIVGTIRKNTKVSLLGGGGSKRVMTILNRQGKGLNGATYKCTINNTLHVCKIQQRLYLAKKEIFFSYILKTRKMLKHRKYSGERKGTIVPRGWNGTEMRSEYSRQESGLRGMSRSGEVFFEVYAKGNLYIFPDEMHYNVHKVEDNSEKDARGAGGQLKGARTRGNRGGSGAGKRRGKRGVKRRGIRGAKHNAEGRSEGQREAQREGQSEDKGEHNSERRSQGQREKHSSEKGTSLLIMGTHKHVTSLNELINTFIRKGHQAINEELVLFIVYHLIVALLQLHVLDVLHGDVKIDNILVAKDQELLLQMERTKENITREPPRTCKREMKEESKRKRRPHREGNSGSSVRGGRSRNNSGTRSVRGGSSRSSSGIRSIRGGRSRSNSGTRSIRGGSNRSSSNPFVCEYMLNVKGGSNPNSFLRNKFPLNVLLIDIGRGIDVKNFRNYLFYGEKNCDCYNFLSDSIFTYHIDFIGIAQVASCLLYYKHLGSTKYKYDGSIMDQNYATINNLNLTYMTHNNNFTKNSSAPVRRKRRHPRNDKRKSRCKEIESFIKVKERAYTEDEEKQDEGCTDQSASLEGGKHTGKSSRRAANSSHRTENTPHRAANSPHPVGRLQRSLNYAGNKQSESNKRTRRAARRSTAAESTHFIDYSKNIPMDDRDRKKIDGYIDEMKKNNENYYIEREEESKIKNFSVKLLSTRKRYIEFWEIFFHLLLNFCNVYELSSVNYNTKDMGTNFEKANLFHHKVMNKTENYYFDFCKNNWEEVPQGDQQNKGTHMKEKLNGLLKNNDNLHTRRGKAVCSNGDSHKDSVVMDSNHTDEAKDEMGKLCHHDNTSTDDRSNSCSMQNRRCDDEKEALEEQQKKQTNEEPHKDNTHQVDKTNAEREITKGAVLDKKNQQTNGDQPKSNSKYFFIKNSISNLKNIKKKMHKVKHKIERDKLEASHNKGKNDSSNFSGKEENVRLKRKMIFFENEQNRQKCRKLNDQKYYAKECRANDTRRLTRYVNKLMKKKAIFVLMFLKRAIEKIFDDDRSRQEILLSEIKNAAAFF